jgi:hypothetical protein
MLWLHQDKQGLMTHRYKERGAHAQILDRDIAHQALLGANAIHTKQAFEAAEHDEHQFTTIFGEPMPDHLRTALAFETDLWIALHTTLASVHNAHLTNDEYQRLVPTLRNELGTITKLLDIETEILHSPLTKRFTDELHALRQVRA